MFGLISIAACSPASQPTQESEHEAVQEAAAPKNGVRIATFNIRELSTAGLVETDEAGRGLVPSIRAAAEVIARVRPDILVVQEIDHDLAEPNNLALNAERLRDAYLRVHTELEFPYVYAAPSNTGVISGFDFDNDGRVATAEDIGSREYGGDSFGFGLYPGQYSMAVLSRFPIARDEARTFQNFLWKDLPGHHLPPDFYSPEELAVFRLSSKSHWDLPIEIGGRRLHLWVSHPTPPVFDGEEDRNGRRNYDEIAFWKAYLDNAPELVDDHGVRGGFSESSSFVIAGDLNSDPSSDGAVYDGRQSIRLLLEDPRIQDTDLCRSEGAAEEALSPQATAGFAGGLRVDYVLPSADIRVVEGGVFWPAESTDPEGHRLAAEASDHHLTWIEIDPESLR